eukprot:gene12851-14173_t
MSSGRMDSTLSVNLGTLTESEPNNGGLREKDNDFPGSVVVVQQEEDHQQQGFHKENNLVSFEARDKARHEDADRLLNTTQRFDVDNGISLVPSGRSTSTLQAPSPNNDGGQNGGLGDQQQHAGATSGKDQSTGTTRRRPSYTSKAPSALNTLPGITISEYSPVRQTFDDTAQTQSLNQINSSVTAKQQPLAHHKEANILPSQCSFDESLDGYSNPGTPSSVKTDSPAPSPIAANHLHHQGHIARKVHGAEVREKNRVSFKTKWDDAAKSDVLIVTCRNTNGELHKSKLGSGSKGKSIKVNDMWLTPTEFEQFSGRGACKDWKRSIRYGGITLHKLIDEQVIAPHAVSCTCPICCGDDNATSNRSLAKSGPVKLFVPYTKAKRKRRDGEGSVSSKRLSTGGEDNLKDLHRGRSFSMDSEVFPGLVHSSSLVSTNLDDGNMPPMTPVTPMTPITPITPFTPMTPLTPNALRSGSPPKQSSLVAGSLPTMVATSSMSLSSGILRPPATPTKSHHTATNADHPLANQYWIQLEEMATSLISMAQQLKFMIDQAKVQSDALRDTAVTQAKIEAETDKREAVNQIRLQSFSQLSHALSTSQADANQLSIIKNCQNCSRDALLECTGCHKVYYCSQFCQKKDWVNHQKICGEHGNAEQNASKD